MFEIFLSILLISALFATAIINRLWNEHIRNKEKENKEKEANKAKERHLTSIGAPIESIQFHYISGIPKFKAKTILHTWIDKEKLYFLKEEEPISKYELPIDNINYYSIKGDLKQETELIGNRLSIGGTMMAEDLLGTAAAIRRNQIIPITKTLDQRKTIINTKINGKDCFIFFEKGELYNYLLTQIPEKEQSFIKTSMG